VNEQGRVDRLSFDHGELVALYVLLSRHDESLDSLQREVLGKVTSHLYGRLSVSEMEEIEEYYRSQICGT
jgi:hypothetical protein